MFPFHPLHPLHLPYSLQKHPSQGLKLKNGLNGHFFWTPYTFTWPLGSLGFLRVKRNRHVLCEVKHALVFCNCNGFLEDRIC